MYKNILVPIDLSHPGPGRKALAKAASIADADGRITALYVSGDVPAYVASELPAGLLAQNLARAEQELNDISATAGATASVRTGHPSTIILEEAEKLGADLIVIASHRPGLENYLLGSTASRVVRHAPCAVLVDR